MAVDYDLVVIGNSAAGAQAAIAASQQQARVALVTQGISAAQLPEQRHRHTLLELGRLQLCLQNLISTDLWQFQPVLQADEVPQWLETTVQLIDESRSLPALASVGIDVIAGMGQFCQRPHLGFVAGDRCLTARAYLIATGSRSQIPAIPGLANAPYWTMETLLSQPPNWTALGQWLILGGTTMAIEVAQSLRRLGAEVTLVVTAPQILSIAEAEVSYRIQAQLEAEGVEVITGANVTQVRSLEQQIWLQVGHQAIATDHLLVATGQIPNVDTLNLTAVGVNWDETGMPCDRQQQAAPRIYACEGRMGIDCFSHLASQEAMTVVQKLLIGHPTRQSPLRPWVLFTEPEVAQVGMTLSAALQRHAKQVIVLQRSLKAGIQQPLDGQCQLIVHRNGTLLGATVMGNQASELIGTIALAMQEGIHIATLAHWPAPSPTWLELLQQVATDWHGHRPAWQKELRESWFNLRRSWTRN